MSSVYTLYLTRYLFYVPMCPSDVSERSDLFIFWISLESPVCDIWLCITMSMCNKLVYPYYSMILFVSKSLKQCVNSKKNC